MCVRVLREQCLNEIKTKKKKIEKRTFLRSTDGRGRVGDDNRRGERRAAGTIDLRREEAEVVPERRNRSQITAFNGATSVVQTATGISVCAAAAAADTM